LSSKNRFYRSPDKTVWFGRANGLWRLVHGSLARVELPKEMADQSAFFQTITEDHSGGMWVSFGRHGLYQSVAETEQEMAVGK
jgi:hypothetical protein